MIDMKIKGIINESNLFIDKKYAQELNKDYVKLGDKLFKVKEMSNSLTKESSQRSD